MQTEALSVGALFRPDRSFRTPFFQRRYIWTETDQLEQIPIILVHSLQL